MWSFFVKASDPLPFFVFNYLVIIVYKDTSSSLKKLKKLKKLSNFGYKKKQKNQMANRNLNFEAGNGNPQ